MNITCYDIDGNLLKTLTQWDINQKIVINNLSLTNTPEVHFCNTHSELALVGESTYSDGTLTTEVPNILLQENLPIIVYIYVPKGDGSAKTTYSIRIPVNPRPKPADYEYSDNAHFITYEELQAALANSVEVIELANSAADRANEAASVAETSMEYGKNNFANVVKYSVSGKNVKIDNISPIEHNVKVKVGGKNLFNISKVSSVAGLTNNGDGTLTVSGINIADETQKTLKDYAPSLEIGKTYILSGLTTGTNKYIYLRAEKRAWQFGAVETITENMLNSIVSFSSAKEGGDTISNIQIEEGDTATEYEPYIDPTTVSVTGCGKNLLPYPFSNPLANRNGVTVTDNGDGSFVLNGTATSGFSYILFNNTEQYLKGKFTVSGITGGSTNTYYAQLLVGGKNSPAITDGATTFEFDGTWARATLFVIAGSVFNNTVFKIQIEEGDTATEYEPFKGGIYTPNPDGTCDVKSVSPFMQIFTDNQGATIDCEYNIKTEYLFKETINKSKDYANNMFSNTIKGSVNGEFIQIDDVAPVEHNVKVKVKSKNLLNINNIDGISTSSKFTITDNTLSLIPNEQYWGIKIYNENLNLEIGKTYTFSCNYSGTHENSWTWQVNYADGTRTNLKNNTTLTLTIEKEVSAVSFYLGFPHNLTETATLSNIQIEEGETVTEYEPYIDTTTVTVTGCGKNLFDYDNVSFASSLCEKKDNKYIINNTNNSVATYASSTDISALHLKPNTTYISKAIVTQDKVVEGGASAGSMSLSLLLQTTNSFNTDAENPKIYIVDGYVSTTTSGNAEGTFELLTTFTTPVDLSPYVYLVCRVSGGVIVTFENIQIEEGNTSTEYEPFKGGSYTPNPDGTCDVKSVSPFMQIFTYNPGVTIDAEYNRDTEKAIIGVDTNMYVFSVADLKSINDRYCGGNSVIEVADTTINNNPAIIITFRLYTAINSDGNITKLFDLPMEYNPKPNELFFEPCVWNASDFKSGYLFVNGNLVDIRGRMSTAAFDRVLNDILDVNTHMYYGSNYNILGVGHRIIVSFSSTNNLDVYKNALTQLVSSATHVGWEYTPTKHKIITPKYLGD